MGGFVYIIESPSSQDLFDGRCQGEVLGKAFSIAGIPSLYNLTPDFATFQQALGERFKNALLSMPNCLPVLHFVAHGNSGGINLTSNEFISWTLLHSMLQPFMQALNEELIICMSSCSGASAGIMANRNAPTFGALVGNTMPVTWSDATVAYMAFYHLLFKGLSLPDCVDAMKRASGNEYFLYCLPQEVKEICFELHRQRAEEARQSLIEATRQFWAMRANWQPSGFGSSWQ